MVKNNEDTYVVITPGEDGARVEVLSKEELESRLDEEWYGPSAKFLGSVPNVDPNYWGENDVIVLKADFVIPKPIQSVTKWEV